MKILIIGATRGIGAKLLEQALEKGCEVTVLARSLKSFSEPRENLRIIQGDIRDAEAVKQAVAGQEGVVVTIGIKPTFKRVDVFSQGTQNVVTAMQTAGVQKLICVTGIGAGGSKGHGGFFYDKVINPSLLKTNYDDKERQEAVVRQSDLEWEIVRPGFLTNGALTGRYLAITDLQGVTSGRISRADVAHFILNQLEKMTFLHQAPLLTY